EKKAKKIGYYRAEEETFLDIMEATALEGCRNPLVYILEAADDIAYLLGDLEDAFNKGIVPYEMFALKYKEFVEKEQFEEKSVEESLYYYLIKNYEKAKENYGYEAPGEYALKSFVIKLNRYFRDAVVEEFMASYDQIMEGAYEGELLGASKAAKISFFLRNISKEYVYNNGEIVENEIIGYNIIHKLLDQFVAVVLDEEVKPYKGYKGKVYTLISKNYRLVCENCIEEGHLSEAYCKLLLVTDFICGMTDTYAAELYQQLTAINL
ncbi:MAG: hypothetical protein ACRCWY_14120, partial [Cellulosilyticaceae bacterium]